MGLRVFNSVTRTKEDFVPQNPPVVTFYNCGPTVYDYFHIGNARNFVVVDAIRRYMEFVGYRVRFVQNFTDIDDKIIKRANENGEKWDALANRFIEAYFENADALNVMRAEVHPRATEHIPHMVALVEKLVENGLAYESGGDVYFRVRAFKGYGALSGRNLDDLKEGARVEVGEVKEDPLDFTLWKASKPGEPSWSSPWGEGRPGWHLECSAMSMEHLGETLDIHSGGTDLLFPHHENECAQSCGSTGKQLARYWLHNGFLTINETKMSKSLGNFFTINEVLAKHSPATVRFYLLSAHYRHPLEYSEEALKEAESAVQRIREAVLTGEKILGMADGGLGKPSGAAGEVATRLEQVFMEAMDDDFNTQRAMGVVFEAVGALNENRIGLARDTSNTGVAALVAGYLNLIRRLLDILGMDKLIFDKCEATEDVTLSDSLLDLLVRVRKKSREVKQFELSDMIRDELAGLGVRLQDHPSGTIWIRDQGQP